MDNAGLYAYIGAESDFYRKFDEAPRLGESFMNHQHSWDRAVVESIARALRDKPGALMPILRRIQDELGWVPHDSVPVLAEILNLSRAEIHGVLTFYHDFRHQPPGHVVVKVCRAESCQAVGGVALAEHVKRRLGCDFGETSADGAFTLEPVYCLGNCACSPAVVVDGELIGRVTPERFDAAVAALDANNSGQE